MKKRLFLILGLLLSLSPLDLSAEDADDICGRTQAIQEAIIMEVEAALGTLGVFWRDGFGDLECDDITPEDLELVVELDLSIYSSFGAYALNGGGGFLSGTTELRPRDFSGLVNLERLDLTYGGGGGRLPDSLGELASLRYLSLGRNEFSGPIPDFLGNLENLEVLILQSNGFSGEIPSFLGNLRNMRSLNLSDNYLTGGIPQSLAMLGNLETLRLHQNNLSGSIPEGLEHLIGESVFDSRSEWYDRGF